MTLPRKRSVDLAWPVAGLVGCVVVVAGIALAAFGGDLAG
jgi:hypothetical protein